MNPDTLEEEGPFGVLFLRITEAIAAGDTTTVEAFQCFIKNHPEVKVKDPIQGQATTVRRDTMADLAQLLKKYAGDNF